ncbi:MAG TPA: hypothetical protein VLE97_07300, partial [Gaiellaceae bacterium]|nr:hypothetical protein [Gaiellaceae bacterium]
EDAWREGFARVLGARQPRGVARASTDRLTETQIEEIDRASLTTHRQVTLPTMQLRQLVSELRDARDEICLLQLKVDGGKAIVEAVEAAASADVHTKLSAIQIERPNGPPFYLVDALRRAEP